MLLKTMKYNHLLLPLVFLTVSIWGCHSNNTPPLAPAVGLGKEGKTPTVYLPNFVRPNEAIIVHPTPTPTPYITAWVSNGHLRYTITDDLGNRHGPKSLPARYKRWTFDPNKFNASSYKSEAQVTGSTSNQTLYTNTVNPNKTPGYYNVNWSTNPP